MADANPSKTAASRRLPPIRYGASQEFQERFEATDPDECAQCGRPADECIEDSDGYELSPGVTRYVPDTIVGAPVCCSCHEPRNLEPHVIARAVA